MDKVYTSKKRPILLFGHL
jgi:hypothetical protein